MADPEAPLSFAQEEIVERMRAHPGCSTRYDLIQLIELSGPVDLSMLVTAVEKLSARHEALRIRLRLRGGSVWQSAPSTGACIVHHAAGGSAEGLAAHMHERRLAVDDVLSGVPLVRIHLAPVEGDRLLFGLAIHHVVIDSHGYAIFWRDLSLIMTALLVGREPELPALERSYLDHSRSERARLPACYPNAVDFVQGLMRTSHAQGREDAGDGETTRTGFVLGPEHVTVMRELSRHHRVSPFLVLLACTGAAYARSAGVEGQLLATDFAHREAGWKRDMVGLFIGTRITAVRDASRSLGKVLSDVRDDWLTAEVLRDAHIQAVKQTIDMPFLLSVQLDQVDDRLVPAIPGVAARALPVPASSRYWRKLLVSWILDQGPPRAEITFRQDLWTPAACARVVEEMSELLKRG